MNRLVGLYPRAWQARYGEELQDLVTLRSLGLRGSIDLILGAVDAHRHPELVDVTAPLPTGAEPVSRKRYADLLVARRLGTASWLGAVAWIFAWTVAAQGPMVGTGDDAYRDGSAAMPLYFGALILLAAGLVGQMIRLPARARVARLGALIGVFAAPIWGLGPWLIVFAAVLFAGLLLLALGAWWSSEWSGRVATAVVGSTLIGIGLAVASLLIGFRGPLGQGLLVAYVSILTVNWLAVGSSLQQLPAVDDDVPAGDDAIVETAAA
ncbi:MAG TPA: hypothetical protein VFX65_00605 [Candidatus Limnocylindrales bacterium]|nr:hypothetical protein [Candidatus Limnocylindrales bacterium]